MMHSKTTTETTKAVVLSTVSPTMTNDFLSGATFVIWNVKYPKMRCNHVIINKND